MSDLIERENEALNFIVRSCRAGNASREDLAKYVLDHGIRHADSEAAEFVDIAIMGYEVGAFEDAYPKTVKDGVDVSDRVRSDLTQLLQLVDECNSRHVHDRFPSLRNTPDWNNSSSVILVGIVEYYYLLHVFFNRLICTAPNLIQAVDILRNQELSSVGHVDVRYNLNELECKLFDKLEPGLEAMESRVKDIGADDFVVAAMDISGWIVLNLTNGNASDDERLDCIEYFSNMLIARVAVDIFGIKS